MSEYKTFARPGDFNARLSKATNNADKIKQEAARQIKGMNAARSLAAEQEQVYLRAMQFAHSSEKESRETNFKLETENRRILAEAQQKDIKTDIEIAKAERDRQPEQTLMQELAPLVPKFTEMLGQFGEQRAKQDRDAATVAAYQHGFTMDTLENILKLNDQLTLSQFQATEYIQGLSGQGWSEENINALYEKQYLTRGSKAWVDNKALALNSIGNYETGLATHIASIGELTPSEQILEVRNYTQDWLTRVNINGRPLSAEVMGTVINPKVRAAERRALEPIQKQQNTTRKDGLTTDQNRVYSVAFQEEGPAGLQRLNSINPSKDKRDGTIDFLINGHKSGVLKIDQLDDFYDSTFLIAATGKKQTLAEHFPGDEKVAALNTYIKNVERQNEIDFKEEEAETMRGARSLINDEINKILASGETITPEDIERLRKDGVRMAGVKFQSDELDYAAEYYTKNAQMEPIALEIGEKLVDNGATLDELIEKGFSQSLLNTETDNGQSLLQRAKVNEKARTSKYFKKGNDAISSFIKEHPTIEKNAFVEKKGLSFEIEYQQKQYREKYFDLLKKNGGDEEEADTMAQADIKNKIDIYLNNLKKSDKGLTREEDSILRTLKDTDKFKLRQQKYLDYREDNVSLGIVAQKLGKKLFMDSVEALQSPIKEVPSEFASVARIYNKTPFEFARFIAPAFGEDAAEFDATTLNTYQETFKPERMPLLRNTYGTAMRPYRATSSALPAARRGSFAIPTPAGQQTPAWSATGAVIKFAEGTLRLGRMYDVKFGGTTFNDYSRHPDEVMSSSGLNSAAAGAYQFMPATWKGVSEKLGLQDFGPEAQEMAGRELLIGRGVDPDRVYTSFEDFNNNLLLLIAPEFASIPKADGKSYYQGQTAKSALRLWEIYQQGLKQFGVN